MTGSAVPVLNVWRQKKISIKGEGSGERGAIASPESRGLADSQVSLTLAFYVMFFLDSFQGLRRVSGRLRGHFRVIVWSIWVSFCVF